MFPEGLPLHDLLWRVVAMASSSTVYMWMLSCGPARMPVIRQQLIVFQDVSVQVLRGSRCRRKQTEPRFSVPALQTPQHGKSFFTNHHLVSHFPVGSSIGLHLMKSPVRRACRRNLKHVVTRTTKRKKVFVFLPSILKASFCCASLVVKCVPVVFAKLRVQPERLSSQAPTKL